MKPPPTKTAAYRPDGCASIATQRYTKKAVSVTAKNLAWTGSLLGMMVQSSRLRQAETPTCSTMSRSSSGTGETA
jgi:hypothetical protein